MKVSGGVTLFLAYMQNRKFCSRATLVTYSSNLNDFSKVMGDKDTLDLTLKDIERYADEVSLRGFKPKTYRNKLTIVRSFVRFLYLRELTLIKPEQIEVPKEQHTEANFLDSKETTLLLKACTDVRDKAMLEVLLSSGVRVSELTDLRYQDLYKRSIIVRHGKGGKPRPVFITPQARSAVDKYLLLQRGYGEGYLFPNHLGERMSRVVPARKVHSYAKRAGIKKHVTVHTLRHTFATTMLRKGARIEDVQQLLGHSSIRTTLLYLHFTNDILKQSYDKIMLG